MLIVRILYGLKSSGVAFDSLLARSMNEPGFTLSLADLCLWMRPAIELEDNGCLLVQMKFWQCLKYLNQSQRTHN